MTQITYTLLARLSLLLMKYKNLEKDMLIINKIRI